MSSRPIKMSKRVPWKNTSELAMLRDWFYPQHIPFDPYSPPTTLNDMRIEAIDHVGAWSWKPQTATIIPHSVASTAELTGTIIQYEQYSTQANTDETNRAVGVDRNRNQMTTNALQLMLSMAFMRFVNGFVDRDVVKSTSKKAGLAKRNTSDSDEEETGNETSLKSEISKGAGEFSMYANASSIGMPSTFVDFRHRLAHGMVLPSLQELVDMHHKALEWLWERWWKVNATGDPGRALWEREESWNAIPPATESSDVRVSERNYQLYTNEDNTRSSVRVDDEFELNHGWIPA